MGTNILKEFVALIWHHPIGTCCFLVLFTPPFHPVLRFFSPLLISTALFIVAILTMGPHLRECSAEDEEEQLRRNSQVDVWEDKTVQLNHFEEHEAEEIWPVTKTAAGGVPSPPGKESGKSKWKELRRMYKDKGIAWLDNLFRNENWKGAGLNDENVSILQEAFPQREEVEAVSLEKSKDKSTGAPGLPEVVVSDRELHPKDFAALGGHDVPSAEKQVVFADAPALHQDASTPTLASINPDTSSLAIGDGGDEDEQFVEVDESGDGYEEGHSSDLETGSAIHDDVQEEFEEAPEALISALQVYEIPSAAAAVLLEQPHSIQHVPPLHEDVPALAMTSSAIHEQTRSLRGEHQEIRAPVFAEMMHDESLVSSTQKEHPEERDDIAVREIQQDASVVPVSESRDEGRLDPENDEAGSPPVTDSIEDQIHPLVSVIQGDSSASEPEDSYIWSTEGRSVHVQEDKSSSNTHEERCIPIDEIGEESLLVGAEIDQRRANLAPDTGIFQERCLPVDATIDEKRSEVPSNMEPCVEGSLSATEYEERSTPVLEIHEEGSHVPGYEFNEEVCEEIGPVSGADEEIKIVAGRLGLAIIKHSLCASETDGKPYHVEEVLSSEVYERPPVIPGTDTLQERSGDISSREISVEGASPIATHNPEEKLIPVLEEETRSHVWASPKHEEESVPTAEFCLDAAAGSQVHKLPVETPGTDNSTSASLNDTADKIGNDSALDPSITQVFSNAAAAGLNATNIRVAEVHNCRLSFSDAMDQASDGAMVNSSVHPLKSGSHEHNIIELPTAEAYDSTIAVEQAGGEPALNPVNAFNEADHTPEPIEICHDHTISTNCAADEAGAVAVMITTVQLINHANLRSETIKSTPSDDGGELTSDATLASNHVVSRFPVVEYDHDRTSDVEGLTKEGSEIVLNPDSETIESDGSDSSKEVKEVTYSHLQLNHTLDVDYNVNKRLSSGANNTTRQLSTAQKIVAMEELSDSILDGPARDQTQPQAYLVHKALQPTTAEQVAHISDKLKGFIAQGSSRRSNPTKEFTEKPSPALKEGSFALSQARFSSSTSGTRSLLRRIHFYSSSDDSSGDEEVSLDSDSGSESDMDSELNHHHPAVLSHELLAQAT
ncbi:unnamed protein product [Sphagnum compactum]